MNEAAMLLHLERYKSGCPIYFTIPFMRRRKECPHHPSECHRITYTFYLTWQDIQVALQQR